MLHFNKYTSIHDIIAKKLNIDANIVLAVGKQELIVLLASVSLVCHYLAAVEAELVIEGFQKGYKCSIVSRSPIKVIVYKEKERNRFECTIYIVPLSCRKAVYVFISTSNITKLAYINNSYSFEYQKNSYC